MKTITEFILNALFGYWDRYQGQLPYNLNWQSKLGLHEAKFLRQNPIILCDIGASNVAPPELAPFYPHIVYHAFDADKEECERLDSLSHPYRQFCVFPYFIGRNKQRTFFYLYKDRMQSSVYLPGKRYKDLYGGENFTVDKRVEVWASSLEEVYIENGLELPDILKIDTQGSELEILCGAGEILNNACMVEVEVEFLEMYKGQSLFHEVLKFMTEKGFELLYLNRVFEQRRQVFSGQSRGQVTWGDALFGRREDCLTDFSRERLVKYFLLLVNYGHIDFAYHLTQLYPEIDAKLPNIKFNLSQRTNKIKLKHAFFRQLDRFILLLLHFRKYNQLDYDSDRNWPIR